MFYSIIPVVPNLPTHFSLVIPSIAFLFRFRGIQAHPRRTRRISHHKTPIIDLYPDFSTKTTSVPILIAAKTKRVRAVRPSIGASRPLPFSVVPHGKSYCSRFPSLSIISRLCLSNECAYRLSVIVASLCPSISDNVFTSIPHSKARVANVCRSE